MLDLRPYQHLFEQYPNLAPILKVALENLEQRDDPHLSAITTLIQYLDSYAKRGAKAEVELEKLKESMYRC